MLLIKNGTIYTMSDKGIIKGNILIDQGKIIQIEENINNTDLTTPYLLGSFEDNSSIMETTDVQIIDAANMIITPGFIEAHCHVGICGDKKTSDSDDSNEITEPITPYLRGLDGINPMDAAFHNAISAGITTLMAGPGSSNIVGGQFVCMKTKGSSRNIESMIITSPSAMKVSLGENPKKAFRELKVAPMTRMATCALLREELYKAKEYLRNKEFLEKKEIKSTEFKDESITLDEKVPFDFRLEPWLPVLRKEIPIKAHVHRADDILTIIRIGKEFDINVTLDHCSEGHFIADEIVACGYPAIIGPSMVSRNKEEAINIDFKTVGILNKKGVLVAITTDHPVIQIQYLPICAGLAVRYGLDYMEALKAITIYPAMICGVSNRIGSIEIGKDADIAIFNGNPLETLTHTMYTIIDGKIAYNRLESIN